MSRTVTKKLLLCLFILGLSGCSTTDCDPARGGFIRGIGCSASGSYTERQQQMQTMVGQEQHTHTGLNQEYESVNSQVQQTTSEREDLEAEYAQLQNEIDSLNSRLAKSKADNSNLRRNIKSAQNQLNLLKADTFSPKPVIKKQSSAIEKRLKQLKREVDMLRGS